MGVILHTVIVPGGPGSWAQGARWDQYVVQIANAGHEPLVVESAFLIDQPGKTQAPGNSLRELARRSPPNWPLYARNTLLVTGLGGLAYATGVAATGAAAGAVSPGGGSTGGGGLAGDIALVYLPLITDDEEPEDRFKIQAKFEHGRFKLPATIAPGTGLKRSFYFPITPAPQRLVIRGRSGGQAVEAVLELKPLAELYPKAAKK